LQGLSDNKNNGTMHSPAGHAIFINVLIE